MLSVVSSDTYLLLFVLIFVGWRTCFSHFLFGFWFCGIAEVWGDGKTAPCFEQFNPPSNRLIKDLERIHPIYVTTLLHLIETLTGVIYDGPPHPPSSSRASGSSKPIVDSLCEIEDKLDVLFDEFGNL
jgi:hypothetical protein